MIKLINNWIITLIETVLLVAFAVLLMAFDDKLNYLFGAALMLYTLIVVLSKVISYRGMIQLITIIEFFAMTTLAIFVMADIDLLPANNIVNTSVGVAMWFRATTEILHSYLGQGEGREEKKKFNAWKLFLYILLVSFGTFVATTNVVNDDILRYFIVGVAVAAAVIMGVLTYTNYVDYRRTHPKPIKAKAHNIDDQATVGEKTESGVEYSEPAIEADKNKTPALSSAEVICDIETEEKEASRCESECEASENTETD